MRRSIPMFDFQIGSIAESVGRANALRFTRDTRKTHSAARAPKHRGKGRLLSFPRHDEIYRSDVGFKTVLRLRPSAASRWSAQRAYVKGCGFDAAPFPSSAMSLGLGIPWQVALQQSLPPLSQPEPSCNDKKWSVEQFSADSTCLTDSVSQNSPQSTLILLHLHRSG